MTIIVSEFFQMFFLEKIEGLIEAVHFKSDITQTLIMHRSYCLYLYCNFVEFQCILKHISNATGKKNIILFVQIILTDMLSLVWSQGPFILRHDA